MNFSLEQVGAIDIISVGGRLAFDASAEFESNLREAVDEAKRNKVILDFAGVTFISSPVLRSVLSLAKRLSRHGSKLFVIGASDDVVEVFRVSGFTKLKVFELGDRDSAMKALSAIPDPGSLPLGGASTKPTTPSSFPSMPPLPGVSSEQPAAANEEDTKETKAADAAKTKAAAEAAKAKKDADAKAAAVANAEQEAKASAEAKRAEEEAQAQAAAEAEAEAEEEAAAKAKHEAQQAVEAAKAEQEAKIRAEAAEAEQEAQVQAAAKAKHEAQQAAEAAKAEQEAKIRAEAEATAKAEQEAKAAAAAKAEEEAKKATSEATEATTATTPADSKSTAVLDLNAAKRAAAKAVESEQNQGFFGSVGYALKYWFGGKSDSDPKVSTAEKPPSVLSPTTTAEKPSTESSGGKGIMAQVTEAAGYWLSKVFGKKK